MDYYSDLLSTIGNTPMLYLSRLGERSILAKAEFLNPGGSVKDRVAKHIITTAERAGELRTDMTIIEATSGNTGIGVALVGMRKGYRVVIVMPEDMSEERKKLIRALGAELVETPAAESIAGAMRRKEAMVAADPQRYFQVNQFTNPHNPEIHYCTTAPEIWRQMEGHIDAFVAGVGSGGTLGGVGKFLKDYDRNVLVVAVEPANAAALLGHEPGLHRIQGIGDGFIPEVLDTSLIDEVLTVTDEEAISTTRRLASLEGALCGTSSGANVHAALRVAQRLGSGKNVVTVLPDRAERYFSPALL